MSAIESLVEQFKRLSDDDQKELMRELARARLGATARRIADGPEPPMPVSDEELNEIVHEARREVLRARGL